jgi:crotonobetainyl-CoA:carnitine CoA-transferase CaiB-like acyl-CoA transferase
MGREDLIESPTYKNHATRFAIADEVDGLVSEWTRGRRRDELVDLLLEHGVPCAPVRTIAEVAADPEMQRRQMLIDSEFPTRGPIKVIGSPLKFSDAAGAGQTPLRPPVLGEHTAEVLATVGIDSAALEQLRSEGVV